MTCVCDRWAFAGPEPRRGLTAGPGAAAPEEGQARSCPSAVDTAGACGKAARVPVVGRPATGVQRLCPQQSQQPDGGGQRRSEGEPGLAEIASANDALGLRLDNGDSLPGPCPPPRGPGRGLGVPQPSKDSVRDPHTYGSGANPALLRFPHREK